MNPVQDDSVESVRNLIEQKIILQHDSVESVRNLIEQKIILQHDLMQLQARLIETFGKRAFRKNTRGASRRLIKVQQELLAEYGVWSNYADHLKNLQVAEKQKAVIQTQEVLLVQLDMHGDNP